MKSCRIQVVSLTLSGGEESNTEDTVLYMAPGNPQHSTDTHSE